MHGWIGFAITVVFLVLAFALGFPPVFRLLVLLPAVAGANGFLQGAFHFCVRFGTQGLFNFGDIGKEEAVHEVEYRKADQRKAIQIVVYSLVIGIVIALVAFFIPQSHGYEALVGIHPCGPSSAWHVTSHKTSGTKWWETGKADAAQLRRSAIAPRRGPD